MLPNKDEKKKEEKKDENVNIVKAKKKVLTQSKGMERVRLMMNGFFLASFSQHFKECDQHNEKIPIERSHDVILNDSHPLMNK